MMEYSLGNKLDQHGSMLTQPSEILI